MAAIAAQVGIIDDGRAVLSAWHYGRSDGFRTTDADYGVGILVPDTVEAVQSDAEDGNASGAPVNTGVAIAAQVVTQQPYMDWFEKIHIFPGDGIIYNPSRVENGEIDFGNILAQIDVEYEIYSAFRLDEVSLTAINNNVAPGVELPDVTDPYLLGPQTSILDPTSTFNTGGTSGLGNLIRTVVRALLDGLPNFNDSIVFEFTPGNAVELLLSGSRIALITAEFESDLREYLEFATDVIESPSGKEQRASIRHEPREGWITQFILLGEERQRMQNILLDWEDNNFGLPMWHEAVRLTADIAVNDTSFQVRGADDCDFRVGGLAAVITNGRQFDVLQIAAVSDTQIDFTSGTQFAHEAGVLVVPVRVCRLVSRSKGSRYLVDVERFDLEFESTDNETGVPSADLAWNANTYNSRPLVDDPNLVGGPMQFSSERKIVTIDARTGKTQNYSASDRGKRVSFKGFYANSRAQIKSLKRFLRYFRGRQRSFYLPTFIDDLEVVTDLGIGNNTIEIRNIGYTRYAQGRDPKRAFRITFSDGTSLERNIVSSSIVDADTEELVLNTTWPSNRTVSEITRVMFYELVRFDADRFELEYKRSGTARLVAPVKVVFDDD